MRFNLSLAVCMRLSIFLSCASNILEIWMDALLIFFNIFSLKLKILNEFFLLHFIFDFYVIFLGPISLFHRFPFQNPKEWTKCGKIKQMKWRSTPAVAQSTAKIVNRSGVNLPECSMFMMRGGRRENIGSISLVKIKMI